MQLYPDLPEPVPTNLDIHKNRMMSTASHAETDAESGANITNYDMVVEEKDRKKLSVLDIFPLAEQTYSKDAELTDHTFPDLTDHTIEDEANDHHYHNIGASAQSVCAQSHNTTHA